MISINLQSLLREPRNRQTTPMVFAQAISKISEVRNKREKGMRQPPVDRPKQA